jgi:hypothetical protein
VFPFLAALPIIGDVVKGVVGIIDKAVPDKDLAEQLKAQVTQQMMTLDYSAFETEINRRAEIITAEATGESWLQRNWRPLLMLVTISIVANNYIIYPYLTLFGVPSMALELPDKLWNLLTLGVGGYVVGRSAEKVVNIWKNGKK